MSQSVIKVSEDEFDTEITGKDLAVYYRIFAQLPTEAMRLAKIFGEEELSFAAMSLNNRKEILKQNNETLLNKLVATVEKEALAQLGVK